MINYKTNKTQRQLCWPTHKSILPLSSAFRKRNGCRPASMTTFSRHSILACSPRSTASTKRQTKTPISCRSLTWPGSCRRESAVKESISRRWSRRLLMIWHRLRASQFAYGKTAATTRISNCTTKTCSWENVAILLLITSCSALTRIVFRAISTEDAITLLTMRLEPEKFCNSNLLIISTNSKATTTLSHLARRPKVC